jgi:hypothetical protein
MLDIKQKLNKLKIEDYKKTIRIIDSHVDRFTNIKQACEKAGISYRSYYTARDFLKKYDEKQNEQPKYEQPKYTKTSISDYSNKYENKSETDKIFKHKNKNENITKKKDDIMDIMYGMGKGGSSKPEKKTKKIVSENKSEIKSENNQKNEGKRKNVTNLSDILPGHLRDFN